MKFVTGLYIIDEVVSTNVIKSQLPTSMRIHLVINISQVIQYKEQVKEQKVGEVKLVEVKRVEEWKVKRILDKRKVRGVIKYLVQ